MDESLLHHEGVDATTRLARLGVRRDELSMAVAVGLGFAFECTTFAPPSFRGIIAWGKTVESLRLALVLRDWSARNVRNYSTVVHPDGTHAIAVASGDSGTGLPDLIPSTRSEKGAETQSALNRNQLSFADIDKSFPLPISDATMQTWFLLYCADGEAQEIRLELSLPKFMTLQGHVNRWHERIFLEPIAFDSITRSQQDIDLTDEEDISVEKRA